MVASDAGGIPSVPGGPSGGPFPSEPPPTPFERATATPRRRRGRGLAVAVAAVALLAIGAALVTGRWEPLGLASDPDAAAAPDPAVDAALLAVLDMVDGAELAMLAFDDAAGDALADATSEEEALAGIATAAAAGAAELEALRPGLAAPSDMAPAEAVRAAYLPHLDAWITYMAAIAAAPTTVFDATGEPLSLRINATAGVFAAALEEAVAAGVGPDVEEAARAILDRGFPDREDADL